MRARRLVIPPPLRAVCILPPPVCPYLLGLPAVTNSCMDLSRSRFRFSYQRQAAAAAVPRSVPSLMSALSGPDAVGTPCVRPCEENRPYVGSVLSGS